MLSSACAALLLAATVALAGCTPDAPIVPAPAQVTSDAVPEPGRTIAATPADSNPLPSGYRLAVVRTASSDTDVMLDAIRALADASGAQVEDFAADTDDVGVMLESALGSEADLVVGLGAEVVDVFSFETAKLLDQQFLIVGAQIAEPTANVTAVIWDGATSRGSAASADGPLAEAPVTADLAQDAATAGLSSILNSVTGVVIEVSIPS